MSSFNVEEAKKEYLDNIRRYMTDTGSVFPHISVFGMDKTNQKKSIIHIPIPPEYVSSSGKKDEFLDDIFPLIVKEINTRFTAEAVGWAAEAWMTVLDKSDKPKDERKEVLFILISSENADSVFVYDINRTGKQVNSDGDLTDIVELTENTQFDTSKQNPMAGRFAGLYKRFKES
jgi:hypothetical protein